MPIRRRSNGYARKQLGFQQLEERKLLAAIVNGQEIESNVAIGATETFEFQVVQADFVDVSVGDATNSSFRSPRLTILGPDGTEIGTDTGGEAAQFSFTALASGTYTAVVEEDGRNNSLDFRIRALTLPDSPQLIDGRDRALQNGEEVVADIPIGSFNVYPLEVTAGDNVDISVGGAVELTVFGPNGTLITSDSGGTEAQSNFIATQSGTYTAVVEDVGRNALRSIRIRALTTPGFPTLVVGRDEALQNGVEVINTVPTGGFNAYLFEASAGAAVSILAAETSNSSLTSPTITVYGPDGLEVGSDTDTSEALLNFTASQTGTYFAIVEESGRDRSLPFRIVATGIAQLAPEVIRVRRDGIETRLVELLDRPDRLNVVDISFNQDVNVSASDFTITNETTGASVFVPSQAFSYDDTNFTVTFDFTPFLPTLFPSGLYSVSANASAITATSDGRPLVESVNEQILVALTGDLNLDGRVDVLGDALGLVTNLGLTGAGTWGTGDFNGDGNVDVLGDALLLVSRLGQTVLPPLSSVSSLVLDSAPSNARQKSPTLLGTNTWVTDQEDEKDSPIYSPLDQVFAGEDYGLELV